MSSKSRKSLTPWVKCDKCHSILSLKDMGTHEIQCPPLNEEWTHSYIQNCILYSTVDIYLPKELPKNISERDTHDMVFLSQSTLELCEIPIGDPVLLAFKNTKLVKIAWPTSEKSLTSVCLAKHTMELNKISGLVEVSKFAKQPPVAKEIEIEYAGKHLKPKITTKIRSNLKTRYEQKILCADNRISVPFYGRTLVFKVLNIIGDVDKNLENSASDLVKQLEHMSIAGCAETAEFYEVSSSTKWTIIDDVDELKVVKQKLKTTISDIGGYHDLLTDLRDVFDIVLGRCKKILRGFKFSKGILIYGPTGVGKTSIVNALISEYDVNTFLIRSRDIYSKYYGEGDKKLSELFTEAKFLSPSVIVIEDIDVLCTKKSSSENEKRLMATLIQEIDDLQDSEVNTLLVTTSSQPDLIDASLRRAGRIDREFEICAPTPTIRNEILRTLLSKLSNVLTSKEINEISFITHGFVAADLQCLCSQAAMRAIIRQEKYEDSDSIEVYINGSDLNAALTRVKPSAMKEVLVEVPNVMWSDIGGQQSLKLKLQQAVEWPLKHPEAFLRLGITPPRGVLMFGPPGCSKTMVARALATESKLNFINIKGPELFSKWVGESERAVREVFRKARQVAPSIIFIDEIDALGSERASGNASNNVQERVLAQLLTELDGVTALGNVTLVAATNRPDRIDKALLRPGRLDRIVYVPLPDNQTRTEIFEIKFRKMPIAEDVIIQDLVELTEGYSGAEIQAICHEAAMHALEDNLDAEIITKSNFKAALSIVQPRTPASLVKLYEDYDNNR